MKIITDTINIYPESKFNLDSVLFFDIETTGLSKELSNVYLIGCAYKDEGSFCIRQFFADKRDEEEEIVKAFYDFAASFEMIVHFNGQGFDVPYMDHKARKYDISFSLADKDNYDILRVARKAKKLLGIRQMGQKSIEGFLKIKRDDEKSGGELIPYYYEYERTKDENLLKYLLLHNYDDVLGMLKISGITNYADITEGAFHVRDVEETDEAFSINLKLDHVIPVPFEKDEKEYMIAGNDDFVQVVMKKYTGIGNHFIEDYQNYYYLPEEDRVIHKDVAQFVDRAYRVKAKRSNCCIKKESVFLPRFSEDEGACFCHPDNRKQELSELDSIKNLDKDKLKLYALEIIGK